MIVMVELRFRGDSRLLHCVALGFSCRVRFLDELVNGRFWF